LTNAHGQGASTLTYDADTPGNLAGITRDTGTGTTLDSGLVYAHADHRHSPTRYTAPQGTVVNYGYDTAGNLNCLNQLTGPTGVCANDGAGTAVAGQWHIDHNDSGDGTVTRTIDPNGNITDYTWSYDTAGILTTLRIDHPSPRGHEVVSYDLLGRVTGVRDGTGR
jgi:YD repeat-containing protein